jgi:hypothetical protein
MAEMAGRRAVRVSIRWGLLVRNDNMQNLFKNANSLVDIRYRYVYRSHLSWPFDVIFSPEGIFREVLSAWRQALLLFKKIV